MITVQTEVVGTELSINPLTVEQFVNMTLARSGVKNGQITVIFTTDEMLRDLKLTFFQEDVYTDVVAFRLDGSEVSSEIDESESFEGEIYISSERAAENAETYGVSLANELSRLIFHGSLHLVGHDDGTEEDSTRMTHLEDQFLGQVSVETLLKS